MYMAVFLLTVFPFSGSPMPSEASPWVSVFLTRHKYTFLIKYMGLPEVKMGYESAMPM